MNPATWSDDLSDLYSPDTRDTVSQHEKTSAAPLTYSEVLHCILDNYDLLDAKYSFNSSCRSASEAVSPLHTIKPQV